MLVIRLTRKGRKNQPFFRIVVIDKKRSAKGGRAVEVLGYIDPLTKKRSLKKERILHWIKMGAKPSDTMHNLLISEKIIFGKKVHVAKVKKGKETVSTTSVPAKPTEASASAETVVEPKTETKIEIQAPTTEEPKNQKTEEQKN